MPVVIPPDAAVKPIVHAPDPKPTTNPLETPPWQRTGGMGPKASLPISKGFTILGIDPITGDVGCATLATEPMTAPRMASVRPGVGAVAMAGNNNGSWLDKALDELAANKINAAAEALRKTPGCGRRLITLFDINGEERTIREAPIQTRLEYKTWRKGQILIAISGPGYESVVEDAQKRFHDSSDLPLASRLLLALGAAETENAFPQLRSAAVIVTRPANGATTGDGPIVDLRVEYHGAPYQRLLTLYDVALRAQIGPRIMAIQKRTDTQSEAYQKNRTWLKRIQNGDSIRQKD